MLEKSLNATGGLQGLPMDLSGTETLNPPRLSIVPWGKDDGLSADEEQSPKKKSACGK